MNLRFGLCKIDESDLTVEVQSSNHANDRLLDDELGRVPIDWLEYSLTDLSLTLTRAAVRKGGLEKACTRKITIK